LTLRADWRPDIIQKRTKRIIRIAIELQTERCRFGFPVGIRDFSLLRDVQTRFVSLVNGHRRFFPMGLYGRGMKLITHIHPVPRSRMSETIAVLSVYLFMVLSGRTLRFLYKYIFTLLILLQLSVELQYESIYHNLTGWCYLRLKYPLLRVIMKFKFYIASKVC
jgi:hypothetical protein